MDSIIVLNGKQYVIRNNIKKFRETTGYSIIDIAKVTGLSRTAIQNIQDFKAYPKLSNCYLLANFFNVSIDDLFYLFPVGKDEV